MGFFAIIQKKCQEGQFLDKNNGNKCVPCPKGTYQDERGSMPKCRTCTPGNFQAETGKSKCSKCKGGHYCASFGQDNEKPCPVGTSQPKTGQTECAKCMPGWFQLQPNSTTCSPCKAGHYCVRVDENGKQCPAGKFQSGTGQTACEKCPVGFYQDAPGQLKCIECQPGRFCSDPKAAQECRPGTYTETPRQLECADCEPGWFQSESGQVKCNKCPSGRFQFSSGGKECAPCSKEMYQPDIGQKSCIPCISAGYLCAVEGESNPPMHPWVYIVTIITIVVVIIVGIKVVKLLHEALTAWKPQSENDAKLADEFALPKKSDEVRESIAVFKQCEKRLIDNGSWTKEDLALIIGHGEIVVEYLRKRIKEAFDPKQVKIMRCCLKMDALHDFKTLYDATMENIRRKEDTGYKAYTTVAKQLQASTSSGKCPANPVGLVDLYSSGRAVYERFHAFVKKASEASRTGYVFVTHDHKCPGMKGLYRVLEKGVFKYSHELQGPLDLSNVRDLVRGGIIDLTMKGLAKLTKYFLESKEVTACRIKDRFNEPSGAGWTDCMVNFYFNDDPNKHVCEVQLIHFKMLSQRTTQEGHGAYNIYRAAYEILDKTHNLSKSKSMVKKRVERHTLTRARSTRVAPIAPTVQASNNDKEMYIGDIGR